MKKQIIIKLADFIVAALVILGIATILGVEGAQTLPEVLGCLAGAVALFGAAVLLARLSHPELID